MWLINSSIGRKVVMSVTGVALVLFLTFHACMNVVALISEDGYNWICEMLGANWYAVAATVALAGLVLIHFVYAFWLTFQNWKARGNNKYAVTDKPEKVEWASQNMKGRVGQPEHACPRHYHLPGPVLAPLQLLVAHDGR